MYTYWNAIKYIYHDAQLLHYKKIKSISWSLAFFLLLLASNALINAHRYPRPIEGYYSQKGQDKLLNEVIFKGKKEGFFVEIGAHDGVSFSNSYFFERNLGWTGICVEPNPVIFDLLTANRSCVCEQICISDSHEKKSFLLCEGYMLEMYSGLLHNYDPRHLARIDTEMCVFGGGKEVILVDCCTLKSLFKKHMITRIDFLSIDIEGGEQAALESIDFSEVTIDVIVVENNFNETMIKDYLVTKDYVLRAHIGKDDIYIRRGYNA